MMSRILIVEDNRALADNLTEILAGGQVHCDVVSTAEEALSRLLTERFDGIVTDLRLPGMNGLELLRAIRTKGVMVPAVLMTAFADDQTIARAHEAGALDVLIKPVDLARFETLVGQLVGPRTQVLILEDSEALAENILEALSERQVDAVVVPTVKAALEQKQLPALAIVDLRLPDGSGLEAVRRLQARDPSIRVLITTGHAADLTDSTRRELHSIVEPVLEKPVPLEVLIERVERARAR